MGGAQSTNQRVETQMDRDDMALPEGRTCAHCKSYERCRAFIGERHINDKQTRCDWAPSRFRLAANFATAQGGTNAA
jgi:hypothetical protein